MTALGHSGPQAGEELPVKGIVFTTLESFLEENFGEDFLDEVLEDSTLKTTEPFVGPGTYPDEDLVELVVNSAARAGIEVPDALRSFGVFMFGKLAAGFPQFVESQSCPKEFLLSVHDIIHVEVRKLWPDAVTPAFSYIDEGEDRLTIDYDSPRRLCATMSGLLEGVAQHFEVPIAQEETRCTSQGAETCRFELRFGAPKGS